MTSREPDDARPPEPVPTTLRWAVWLLYGEAALVAVLTAFLIYSDLTATVTDMGVAVGVTLFAAVAAVVLVAIARSLARRRPGARGPAIVFQIMALVTGYYLVGGGQAWLGVPLMILALSVGFLVVSPPTTRALGLG